MLHAAAFSVVELVTDVDLLLTHAERLRSFLRQAVLHLLILLIMGLWLLLLECYDFATALEAFILGGGRSTTNSGGGHTALSLRCCLATEDWQGLGGHVTAWWDPVQLVLICYRVYDDWLRRWVLFSAQDDAAGLLGRWWVLEHQWLLVVLG